MVNSYKHIFLSETPFDILGLIEGCRENNRGCQQKMYHFLQGFAVNICYRYTNQKHEIDELVNESFIKLFKNVQQFDTERQANSEALLKGWFKRIVVNTCIDQFRKRHTIISGQELTNENETVNDTGETGFSKLAYKEIIEAIKQLSPVYRAVFNLFVIDGLSHEEIAGLLGISVGASKSNLSKARNNLRKIITEKNEHLRYA
jgi:RNA polymerase sigma-70 factor (ECF subfamily)